MVIQRALLAVEQEEVSSLSSVHASVVTCHCRANYRVGESSPGSVLDSGDQGSVCNASTTMIDDVDVDVVDDTCDADV